MQKTYRAAQWKIWARLPEILDITVQDWEDGEDSSTADIDGEL